MQSNVRVRQLCERKATPYSAHSGRQQAIDRGWGSHPAPFLIYGANAIGANILGSELDRNKMNRRGSLLAVGALGQSRHHPVSGVSQLRDASAGPMRERIAV